MKKKKNNNSRQRQHRHLQNSTTTKPYSLEERDGSVLSSLLKYKSRRATGSTHHHNHHQHQQQQQKEKTKKNGCCFGCFSLSKQRRRILLLVVFPCLLFMSQFWFIKHSEKKHIRHFMLPDGRTISSTASGTHHHLAGFRNHKQKDGQEQQQQRKTQTKSSNNSPYAYVFLLTGAHSQQQQQQNLHQMNKNATSNNNSSAAAVVFSDHDNTSYMLGLFSIISTVHSLRQYGSTADFVVMVQISVHTPQRLKKLKRWEVELLQSNDIHLKYIPKFASPTLEVYYGLSLEKFRILQMTQYDRVMFVDHDVVSVPNCNLDYIFEMSLRGHLRPNVVFGLDGVPSDGSLFVLEPNQRDYDDLVQVITQHEHKMYNSIEENWPFGWNETEGWGHIIDSDDPWVARRPLTGGTKWTFFGSYADQGLLYHYTKYMNGRVSLVREDTVEHWDVVDDLSGDAPTMSKMIVNGLFDKHRPQTCQQNSFKSDKRPTPYQDINHFMNGGSSMKGNSISKRNRGEKPWMINRPELEVAMLQTSAYIKILRQQDPKKMRESDLWLLNVLEALSESKSLDRTMAGRLYGAITTMTERYYRQQEEQQQTSESSESGSSLFYYYTHKPPVGRASTLEQVHSYIKEKARHGWTQYLDDSQQHKQNSNSTDYYDSDKRHIRTSISPAKYDVTEWCNATLAGMKQKLTALGLPGYRSSTTLRYRKPKHKWAYAFFLGSAMTDQVGTDYRYAILSVISAVKSLRNHGSIADMVLMVQISTRSDATQLNEEEETLLKKLNIHIEYVPKLISSEIENFYVLGMEKFRILSLVQYSRVMFMDSDTLPRCNMDYLFELSEPFTGRRQSSMLHPLNSSASERPLKENIVLEPPNGAVFLLKPDMVDWNHVQEIIRVKDMYASLLPYPHFDQYLGWGHLIETQTQWLFPNYTDTKWSWDSAFADKGLLYHLTKYVKRSVSFVENGRTENWAS
eukprot:CAMPEP_0113503988 /NCGR_PEP_ID=MMETSP0014_2-20120614/34474_1 /TAXON_ID=2857 /ORGANISM="Nitzschia sp." /LENGTH=964 /DNA_ID=CAMNT_0000399065 /DNA_START=141 /DNA_END=3031 /DNA_ORIENTATION=+ /assembly_acc=CAM_ASM_000159